MKIFAGFVAVVAVAAALFNANAMLQFEAKFPGSHGPYFTWIGVIILLVIAAGAFLYALTPRGRNGQQAPARKG